MSIEVAQTPKPDHERCWCTTQKNLQNLHVVEMLAVTRTLGTGTLGPVPLHPPYFVSIRCLHVSYHIVCTRNGAAK